MNCPHCSEPLPTLANGQHFGAGTPRGLVHIQCGIAIGKRRIQDDTVDPTQSRPVSQTENGD